MFERFRIDGCMLEDTVENEFYTKDKSYIHIANAKNIGGLIE